MIFVGNNIPVLATVQDIIMLLQKTLHMEGIPLLKDVIYPKYGNQDIMITCPFHKNGNEGKPSMGIQTRPTKGNHILVHCFTCHEKGTLETLVSRCFGYTGEAFGTQWILNNFNSAEIEDRNIFFNRLGKSKEIKKEEVEYVTEEELDKYRYYHPYQYKRYLTNDIIDKYDIGYDANFKLGEAITFPVKDENGKCLFVARRTIHKKSYWYPPSSDKPIYGIWEARKLFPNAKEVYICESMLNALTFIKNGFCALAMLGTGTNQQYEKLKELPYRKYVVATDGDKAGLRAREKLMKALKYSGFVSALNMPEGKDINDYGGFSKEDFVNLVNYIKIVA